MWKRGWSMWCTEELHWGETERWPCPEGSTVTTKSEPSRAGKWEGSQRAEHQVQWARGRGQKPGGLEQLGVRRESGKWGWMPWAALLRWLSDRDARQLWGVRDLNLGLWEEWPLHAAPGQGRTRQSDWESATCWCRGRGASACRARWTWWPSLISTLPVDSQPIPLSPRPSWWSSGCGRKRTDKGVCRSPGGTANRAAGLWPLLPSHYRSDLRGG